MNGTKISKNNVVISTSLQIQDGVPLIVYDIKSRNSDTASLNIAHPLPDSVSPDQVVIHPEYDQWDVSPIKTISYSIRPDCSHPMVPYFETKLSPKESLRTCYAVEYNTKDQIRDILKRKPKISINTDQTPDRVGKTLRNPITALTDHVDGYSFEHFIAELWEIQGWKTKVTDGSGDEGVDIVATRNEPYQIKHNIQVKHYTDTVISRPDVQQYSGLQHLMDVDAVAIVSSSTFSGPAEDWAEKTNVKLIDKYDLIDLIERLEADDLVYEYISSTSTVHE